MWLSLVFGAVGTVLVLGLFSWLLFCRRRRRFSELAELLPGPKPWPLLGDAHLFFGLSPAEACLMMGQLAEKYGDTFKLRLGPYFSVMFFHPSDVEQVLSSTQLVDKADEYDFLARWLNEGLLVSTGRKWHKRRKIITPAFHFRILEQYVEIFDRQTHQFLSNLDLARGKDDNLVNLGHAVHLCALDVICETAMGVSINAQTNADSEYVQAVKTISMVLHKRMFNIFYRFDLTYMLTPLARAEKRALHVLHEFTEKIIVQRREELIRGGSKDAAAASDDADADVGAKRKMAFLDILLQSTIDEKPLTNLDIREEVDTFMFEGHDTTSSALMFFFYNVATHPEAQKKCFEEISSVIGQDKSTPVTYELLNKLHYVDLCIKETLRMYPSVPLLGRRVVEECEINGKRIPAGTNIGISPLYLGRREELFSEPNSFKPERFDVVTSAEKLNPYAYIPFSAGPRNCIGQKFAMLEIKAIVANVLRHYHIDFVGDTTEPPVLIAELILRTKDPLLFKLQDRVY
ncbi:cytochrome P450 4d1 isoform X2 [Drosophila pseudoobscura]|uniref:Cytochrome P450 4d1 isoform X2 n=1 Tax=Drosophila pseudoobscura pseudoobscura TaxID=46245 RepID=A0A6I8VHR9_DROPS|nr:cytochrome P450 4d1 isoform X2 [Drosophila pseudoobscura]